jgi:hypothetical protein
MKPAAPAQEPLGFRAETRGATRGSGYLLGAIGIVAVAAWAGMDVVLQPANAKLFIALRCLCVAGMGVICALLRTSLGERRPEALVFALVSLPQIAIAIMVSRLHGAYSAYATGFSLAIYASALLLIWQWTYTAALIGLTWVALVGALLISPRPPSSHELTTVGLYLAAPGFVLVASRSAAARQLPASSPDTTSGTSRCPRTPDPRRYAAYSSWRRSHVCVGSPSLRPSGARSRIG